MAELKNISLAPVQLSTSKLTKFLTVKQGDNQVDLSREAINNLRKLRNGGFDTNAFSSQMLKNKFSMDTDDNVTVTCNEDTVILRKTKRYDDVQRILDYTEKHKRFIAWERDFKRRR